MPLLQPSRRAAEQRRSTVAAYEESTPASAAGKRLSVWSAQSSCNCSDHQTFACLCMRGSGRKLVAIQTEVCVFSWGGASDCCSEPCGDLLTELLSPGGRKRLTMRMPDKVSETAAGLSADDDRPFIVLTETKFRSSVFRAPYALLPAIRVCRLRVQCLRTVVGRSPSQNASTQRDGSLQRPDRCRHFLLLRSCPAAP